MNRNNKIRLIIFLFLLIVNVFTGCSMRFSNSAVLPGYVDKVEFFDEDGFQDYTDYCKYFYDENGAQKFYESERYQFVGKNEIDNVKGYFENLEMCMESMGRSAEYDFNDNCISEGDYVFINTKEGTPVGNTYYGKYENYSVYFFDTESRTLYYIHNNI